MSERPACGLNVSQDTVRSPRQLPLRERRAEVRSLEEKPVRVLCRVVMTFQIVWFGEGSGKFIAPAEKFNLKPSRAPTRAQVARFHPLNRRKL